ncbi:glycoprotease [Campylobacter sp. RM9344]|uniref:Glycoprotease n=1 Tax=Campylobacter californiensis TaxID=1032243 RepID=A0AAW3ZUI6_9BACT|nr:MULTISPECIES: glycoprotease [unclassified Campylobacter]MBE2984388.1 glycoprotease [Campylobacter sp. RM6883]MBE2995823.1 glycoprotease [Campylobacter sp. RM6913]MBE3029654.1 glycoprotease [Campylobacter sp. RM9344]MBE3607139.1 glycoprotease [Campylobacter sp. RM9337]QCD50262.1 N6-L-threonylcarbamoyladenine synthase, TsaB subunit [Campylobacter sp. RM6914]
MVGLYENDVKFKEISTQDHVSEALIEILEELDKEYNIQKIIYANTPGSFMGLKVAYVILKTFCEVRGCEFYAVSGFDLNENNPIRANKKLSFVKYDNKIVLEEKEPVKFKLPQILDKLKLNSDTLPDYIIQAV